MWVYIGIYTGFMLGAYGTTLFFTESLSKSNTLIPLYSLAVGFGEVSSNSSVPYFHIFFQFSLIYVIPI